MRYTFLRLLTIDERNYLHLMLDEDTSEIDGYRVKIILLKDAGFTVPEIRRAINHHDSNIRKWIHRFNEKGIDGIASRIHKHKPIKMTDDIEKMVVEIATKNPRKDYRGLPFSTWSLRILAGFIFKEMNIVDSISHTEVRNILLKHGIRYRKSKITLGNSLDPEYHLKKRELKI
jgi:transposase